MQVVLNSAGRAGSCFKSGESRGVRSAQRLFFGNISKPKTHTKRMTYRQHGVKKCLYVAMTLVLLKFCLIILFYIVDELISEVKIHATKEPTQIQSLEIIVATPTIGSVIQESNLSKKLP